MTLRFIATLAVTATLGAAAQAQEYKLNGLHIDRPYARATVANQPAGGAYLTIENKGKAADRLIAASSPVAMKVEIHTMSMESNVMKMRQVDGIELKPSAKIEMKPGDGYHLMLMGLQQPLKAGEKFPLTLTFEKAGKTEVSVTVQDKKESKGGGTHHMH
jgi:periplasmic copper chaperone A